MPVRRLVDVGLAQDDDGHWREQEVVSVARFRVRVVSDRVISDRGPARAHQAGVGEEFEIVVDNHMQLWARRFGADSVLRRDVDGAGVSLVVVEDVTAGVRHDASYPTRPSDDYVRWSCSCGQSGRGWLSRPEAEQQVAEHTARAAERDVAQEEASRRYLARREQENLRILDQARGGVGVTTIDTRDEREERLQMDLREHSGDDVAAAVLVPREARRGE